MHTVNVFLNSNFFQTSISVLNSNFFQTLAVFGGGLIAYRIYKVQEKNNTKNAAIMVCLEIESIMNAIKSIKLLKFSEAVFQTRPIYQSLYWFEYRNSLVREIGKDNVGHINEFYDKVISCEEARKLFQDCIALNRNAKTIATQEQIAVILKEARDKYPDYYNKKTDKQRKIIKKAQKHLNEYENLYFKPLLSKDFVPASIGERYEVAFREYKDIEAIAYQNLKRVAGIT
jgi:hypothetical protein